ncbi:flippase-like domain-containing protein [Flavisolibacter sp. BT320]|nr:flippase-like domain-containing protein [Flavisolibacter longurius]
MLQPQQSVIVAKAAETEKKAPQLFDKKRLVRRCLWFTLITILTIAAIFIYNNSGASLKALWQLKFSYLIFCFGLLFIDLMLGSWRNHIFMHKLKPGLSQWVSFRANVANMFMGAVTPAHGGAAPAQIYVYMRSGVRFIDAFTVSLINMGATLVFMPLAGLLALLLLDESLTSGLVMVMLQYGFGFFSLFLVAFLLAFWKPVWIAQLISHAARWIAARLPRYRSKILRWSDDTAQSIQTYQQTCRLLLQKNKGLFPLSLLITTVLYLNKYCMQYFILLGLGIEVDLLQVISIQILIQFMIYFAPSPGGSGFAEMSIAVLFGKFVPAAVLPLFTLLQRSYLLFFPAVIGATVVLRLLQRQAKTWGEEPAVMAKENCDQKE